MLHVTPKTLAAWEKSGPHPGPGAGLARLASV